MIIWKLAMSKKFPCQITFHNNKSSSGEESDQTGWSYKDGALEPYYVQFGNPWSLGMLNELAVIILAKKLGIGGMDELYRKNMVFRPSLLLQTEWIKADGRIIRNDDGLQE